MSSMMSQHQQMPPVLPHAAWMWKPRSKKVVEGKFRGAAASFFGVRNVGAQEWKRRYVFVEGNAICYGYGVGSREKVIPLEVIRAANYASCDVFIAARAPSDKVQFGWFMCISGKELLFCCENDATRKEWVTFILASLQLMSGLAKPVSPRGGAGTHTISSLVISCIEQGRKSPHHARKDPTPSTATQADASVSNSKVDNNAALMPPPRGEKVLEAPEQQTSRNSVNGEDSEEKKNDSDDEDEEEKKAGEDGDDEGCTAMDEFLSHHTDDTLDEDVSDEEDGDGCVTPRPTALANAVPHESSMDMRALVLLEKAQEKCSHIEYKLRSLKEHFKTGDGVQDVVFSRTVEKIGRRDTVQERDLILTPRNLYLIAENRLTGGTQARYIATDQIFGVIESTVEGNLLAVIVPSFHDLLIRFNKQNSCVGGDEVDVKLQFIAHLYKIHLEHYVSQRFFFREVENVKVVIRRSAAEQHLPLMSFSEDRMHAGTNKNLLSLFRSHAESVVYWSSMVTRVKGNRRMQLRALVITDGAVYFVRDTLAKVSLRIPLVELLSVQFDRDSQIILFHCRKIDLLFMVQSSVEFMRLIDLVPDVLQRCCGVRLIAAPSKQLYAQANLGKAWKKRSAMYNPQSTGDISKGHMKLPRRVLSSIHPLCFQNHFKLNLEKGKKPALQTGNMGSMVGMLGASPLGEITGGRAFLARYRFVEELVVDFEDERSLLINPPPSCADSLSLNREFSTDFDVGHIFYSSLCKEIDLRSLPSVPFLSDRVLGEHSIRRVICVCTNGILLLHYSDEIGKLRRALKALLGDKFRSGSTMKHTDASSTHDPRVVLFLSWTNVDGLVYSHSRNGTVVGVMTGSGHSCDHMLDIESNQSLEWLICSSAWSYVQHGQYPPHSCKMLSLFTVPHAENVRNALKRTVFDPMPTIALRCAAKNVASDKLHLAVVPEIAESCRRFGDNTIYFSGVAWHYTSSVLKKACKMSQKRVEKSSKEAHRRATFILIVTNCAVYWSTSAGLAIVRRTELRDIKEVYLSQAEPDALLITVPKEYDMYFHLDGRAREFLARLQEAYAAWTDYDLYLPHESQTPHYNVAKQTLPVTMVPHLVSVGQLAKPHYFDKLQENRSSSEIKRKMESLHRRFLAEAIAKHEAALEAAFRPKLPNGKLDLRFGTERLTWEGVYKNLKATKFLLEFVHRRAYRFSLRSTTCQEMERAQLLLYQFLQMVVVVEGLEEAVATENLNLYEAAFEAAKKYNSLCVLVEENREMHAKLRKRKCAMNAISTFIASNARPSLKEAKDTLQLLFEKAIKSGVQAEALNKMRLTVDLRAQQESLIARLQERRTSFTAAAKELSNERVLVALLMEAARQLEVPVSLVTTSFSSVAPSGTQTVQEEEQQQSYKQEQRVFEQVVDAEGADKVMCDAIDTAVSLGDVNLLGDILQFAERFLSEEVKKKVSYGREQLVLYREHQMTHRMVRRLAERVATCQTSRSWTLQGISELHELCTETLRQLPVAVPFMERDRRLLQLQLNILEEEEHCLALQDSMRRRAQEAQTQYKEELRLKKENGQQSMRERERREAEANRRRRENYLLLWKGHTQKLCASLEEAMQSGVVSNVARCVRQCIFFQKEVHDGLAQYSCSAVMHSEEVSEKIVSRLEEAAACGQLFLKKQELESGHCVFLARMSSSKKDNGRRSVALEAASPPIPPELLRIIEDYKPQELVEYVQSHEGELTAPVLAKVRELWSTSRERRRWVARLHRAIHTAFALKNEGMLRVHIDTAKAAGHTDEVVESAVEVLAAMQARQNAAPKITDAVGLSGLAEIDDTQTDVPRILAISREYDLQSNNPAEKLLAYLHTAILSMLQSVQRPWGANDGKFCGTSETMSNVVQLWSDVFHHGLRPSGNVFQRRRRDCFDFLQFVAQYNVSGDYMAPHVNRLLSDFGRIKKYNTTCGRSSTYVLIAYMLRREVLGCALSEISSLGPKIRGDVLFEDALLNKSLSDLIPLAYMCEQMDWSSMVSETLGVPTSTTTTTSVVYGQCTSVYNSVTREIVEGGNHGLVLSGEPQKEDGNALKLAAMKNCKSLIRSAIRILFNYFAEELAALGFFPSVEGVRALFDEGMHKKVGILVQDHLVPALASLFRAGFRSTYHLLRTRHVWDAVLEFGSSLQQGSRELNSVTLIDAIQLVEAITDVDGRNRGQIRRLSEDELANVRLRMLLIACLNHNILACFLKMFFHAEEGATHWATKDGLWKFYDRNQSVFHPPDEEAVKGLMDVLAMVSELPFVLIVDRELWWSKRTPGYVFWRQSTLVELESAKRNYLLSERPLPIAEIARRMLRVKSRYLDTNDFHEQNLLRGEYKYFSGKLCDTRHARTEDMIAYIQCGAFFGFWDTAQMDCVMNELLLKMDELDSLELVHLFVSLPPLRKQGGTLQGCVARALIDVVPNLSLEECFRVGTACDEFTPHELVYNVMRAIEPEASRGGLSAVQCVELIDTLGTCCSQAIQKELEALLDNMKRIIVVRMSELSVMDIAVACASLKMMGVLDAVTEKEALHVFMMRIGETCARSTALMFTAFSGSLSSSQAMEERVVFLATDFMPSELLTVFGVYMDHYVAMCLVSAGDVLDGKENVSFTLKTAGVPVDRSSSQHRMEELQFAQQRRSALMHVLQELMDQMVLLLDSASAYLSAAVQLQHLEVFQKAVDDLDGDLAQLSEALPQTGRCVQILCAKAIASLPQYTYFQLVALLQLCGSLRKLVVDTVVGAAVHELCRREVSVSGSEALQLCAALQMVSGLRLEHQRRVEENLLPKIRKYCAQTM